MTLHKISKLIILVLVSLFSCRAFAADNFEIQYIKNLGNNTYRIYWNNLWTDSSALKLFIWTTELIGGSKILADNYIEISNLLVDWWDLSVEKTVTTNSWWVISSNKIKSNPIKFVKEDPTLLKNFYSVEQKNGRYVFIIPFDKGYYNWQSFTSYWVTEKVPVININGTDYSLIKDNSSVYEDGKYYYNKDFIIFPARNLIQYKNIVRLKLDNLFSNYIIVDKYAYTLWKPKEIALEDYNSSKYIKFIFDKPSNLSDLTNIDTYINWNKLVATDTTIFLNNLSIRYDITKFSVNDKVAKIQIINSANLGNSNTVIVNVEDRIENKIKKLDFWKNDSKSFLFRITWTDWWFAWDTTKLKLILNWQEYSVIWTKEAIKNSAGTVVKDIYWNDTYEYNRKINFIRYNNELQIDFSYDYFTGWENIVYIKNENTWKESNKVSFTKNNYTNINYDYPNITTQTTKENITYENWVDISNKKIDFLNKPDRDINLGKFNFNNLKTNNFYRVYFKIKTNLKYNPFYSVKLGTYDLETLTESDSTISFVFDNSVYGKDLPSSSLILNINELSNLSDKNIKFTIWWFNISKYDYSDTGLASIFDNSNSTIINLSYVYDFWTCYDWGKDYCNLVKLWTPNLLINLAFGSEIKNTITNDQTTSTIVNTTSQLTTTNIKKNSPINILDFKWDKNRILNGKFAKLYDDIKAKNITVRQASSLKIAINNILKALKNIEDNKSKQEANSTIRINLKTILEIIKSTK